MNLNGAQIKREIETTLVNKASNEIDKEVGVQGWGWWPELNLIWRLKDRIREKITEDIYERNTKARRVS